MRKGGQHRHVTGKGVVLASRAVLTALEFCMTSLHNILIGFPELEILRLDPTVKIPLLHVRLPIR